MINAIFNIDTNTNVCDVAITIIYPISVPEHVHLDQKCLTLTEQIPKSQYIDLKHYLESIGADVAVFVKTHPVRRSDV